MRLVGFGTFAAASARPAPAAIRAPARRSTIPASTTVRFKAGKGLKDAVN